MPSNVDVLGTDLQFGGYNETNANGSEAFQNSRSSMESDSKSYNERYARTDINRVQEHVVLVEREQQIVGRDPKRFE